MGSGLVRVRQRQYTASQYTAPTAEYTATENTAVAGRHRRGAEAVVLAVRARRVTRHRRPEVGPNDRPPFDPLSDTGSVGLRMFDLGTIPASVTPPRTWRRAAWFTIVASAAALLGLLAVGAMLVGPIRSTDRFDTMPNFPSGAPLAAIGGLRTVRPVSASLRPATSVTTEVVRRAPRYVGRPNTAFSPTAPVIATLPTAVAAVPGGEPVIDPTKLLKQTQTFFAEVTSNAQAAADLTDRTVRDDATALIRQKYGDVSTIQIQSITLDPTNGLTVSLLRVVAKDGTTTTERTTLRFTLTTDPKITNPGG
jgi:hypothetical protein